MKDNAQKAHASTINNYCSEAMRNQIEEKSNFETAVQDKPPVEPLKRMKEHVCIPTPAKCECERPVETVNLFMADTKQQEDEEYSVN